MRRVETGRLLGPVPQQLQLDRDRCCHRERTESGLNPTWTHVLTVGTNLYWKYSPGRGITQTRHMWTNLPNTEREVFPLRVASEPYKELAAALCVHLERSQDPPPVLNPRWDLDDHDKVLIKTTSGSVVAMRHDRTPGPGIAYGENLTSIVLALPAQVDLGDWFRAFLVDLHQADPGRVPREPPRMANPSDWYTPEEKRLAHQIADITEEVVRLLSERDRLQSELADESARADAGMRRECCLCSRTVQVGGI